MRPPESLPLLVVEDSDDDLFLFRRLLGKAGISNPLESAVTGQAAIDLLAEAISKQDASLPGIVFLDLKLPILSGFEVLEWIRAQSRLQRTAIVILSSSAETRDVKRAYELGAHGYLVKYPKPEVLRDVVHAIAAHPPEQALEQLVVPGGLGRP